jgi:hypothetical protein
MVLVASESDRSDSPVSLCQTGVGMSAAAGSVWVGVDYVRGGQVCGFRGRMAATDLQALLSGEFLPPFVELTDVHWIESEWNETERRRQIKVTVYGRHGTVRGHMGTLFLRPKYITSLALLHDCTELIRAKDRFQDEV